MAAGMNMVAEDVPERVTLPGGGSVTARRTVGHKPRVYESGRVCAEDGCDTRLTRYNGGDRCFRHQPMRYPRIRGREFTR
jgi:hypothetical protein